MFVNISPEKIPHSTSKHFLQSFPFSLWTAMPLGKMLEFQVHLPGKHFLNDGILVSHFMKFFSWKFIYVFQEIFENIFLFFQVSSERNWFVLLNPIIDKIRNLKDNLKHEIFAIYQKCTIIFLSNKLTINNIFKFAFSIFSFCPFCFLSHLFCLFFFCLVCVPL